MPVDVVSLNYDFWYEIAKADDQLEAGEEPKRLNGDGVLFYYRFKHAGDVTTPTWVDSGGYAHAKDAMAGAQERTPTRINWDKPAK